MTALIIPPPSALARPLELDQDPLRLYLSSVRSWRSRRMLLCALDRAARIFDAFDRGITEEASQATAVSYPWGFPGALTFAKVQAAVALVAERGHAPFARLIRTGLRGVTRFAFNLGLLSVEDRLRIQDVRPPPISKKTRGRRLSKEEIAKLYEVCAVDQTPTGRRDAAILSVLLGTGLRRFELCALDLEDYPPPKEPGREPITLTVRAGKGGIHAQVIGPPDVALALEAWLVVRGREPGPLFSSSIGKWNPLRLGSRITDAGIYTVCRTRGKQAGVMFTPHDLRRTAITLLLEHTGDLSLAQKFARHSTPVMTSKYDLRDEEALKSALFKSTSGYS